MMNIKAVCITAALFMATGCSENSDNGLNSKMENMSDKPITVNLRYTGKNGNARKFAEEMTKSGTVAKIRAEKGNIKYEYFVSFEDPETLLLIDSWQNQAAIDAHHASPMMKTIAELREKYDLKMTAER